MNEDSRALGLRPMVVAYPLVSDAVAPRRAAVLFEPVTSAYSRRSLVWLALSLLGAVVYALPGLLEAFGGQYVVQDDARLHVFWMARFLDPGAFPADPIADDFQSVAPAGYTALYWLAAQLGVAPFALARVLPVVLSALTALFAFRLCLVLFPLPAAAFLASLLLSQNLWMKDDLASATARAFVYPIYLAFLLFVVARSFVAALISLALLGLFYPQFVPIAAALLLLRLLDWSRLPPRVPRGRAEWLVGFATVAVALVVLLPYLLRNADLGQVMNAAEARQLAEYQPGGRAAFFSDNPLVFWLWGGTSGIIPTEWVTAAIPPPQSLLGLLLPLLLARRAHFPLLRHLAAPAWLLPAALALAMIMFAAAHALLFRLYLPGRYPNVTLRVLLAIAAAIAVCALLDALARSSLFGDVAPVRAGARSEGSVDRAGGSFVPRAVALLVGLGILTYPLALASAGTRFPQTSYQVGEAPKVYEFFRAQPADTLIASVDEEVNNIPSFAQRSVLSGKEYAVPFHKGYYLEFRRRTIDLVVALYSRDAEALKAFVRRYGVDFFLVDRDVWTTRYVSRSHWLRQFEAETHTLRELERGSVPALRMLGDDCDALKSGRLVVLDAACVLQAQ